tara:strand:+ start:248 stop:421 length:174 start_codon:yes stop_codon:yes gene_type:complete
MERCLLEFLSLKAMKDFMSFTNKDLRTLINQEKLIIGGRSFNLLPIFDLVILSEEEI